MQRRQCNSNADRLLKMRSVIPQRSRKIDSDYNTDSVLR